MSEEWCGEETILLFSFSVPTFLVSCSLSRRGEATNTMYGRTPEWRIFFSACHKHKGQQCNNTLMNCIKNVPLIKPILHVHAHKHTRTHEQTHAHTNKHTRAHTDTRTNTRTHKQTHTHTQTHTRTHKHTHTFLKISTGWGPIMLYLFQVIKVTFTDWKIAAMLSVRSR